MALPAPRRAKWLFVAASALLHGPHLQAMDRVRQATRVDEAVADSRLSGRGVVIVLLDRGIDWRHPDVRRPDGATRIRAMLDLSGQRWCDADRPPGVEYSEAQINAALRGGPALALRDAVGHGTLTAGVAAGNGRAFAGGRYRGVAPSAELLIVKLTSEGAPAHDGEPAEAPFHGCLDDALEWVDRQLTRMSQPAVALINSGTQWGPIDGTSAASRAIDRVFGLDRPGRVYVAAAGDEGGLPNHAGGTFDHQEGATVRFRTASPATAFGSLWYAGDAPAEVTVTRDDGTNVGPVRSGEFAEGYGIAVRHYLPGQAFYPWQSPNGDYSVSITFSGRIGEGAIRLRGLRRRTGRFDLYGDVSGPNLTPVISWLDHLVPGRLTDYASTQSAIVVGTAVMRTAYRDVDEVSRDVSHEGRTGGLWSRSSAGPTRDGRRGVDIVAPGHHLFAAIGRTSAWGALRFNLVADGAGWYSRFGGASAAAPVGVGVVALLLERRPTLTARQVRRLLCRTAQTDEATGPTPNAAWGCGKLDAVAALAALEK